MRKIVFDNRSLPASGNEFRATTLPHLIGVDGESRRLRVLYSMLLLEVAAGVDSLPVHQHLLTLARSTPLPQRLDVMRYASFLEAPVTSPNLTA